MKYNYAALPDQLPEKPIGYKQTLLVHLNFGGGKGAASYAITDRDGGEMPFTFDYNTKQKLRGFSLPGVKGVLSWQQLCDIWPRWIARARARAKQVKP